MSENDSLRPEDFEPHRVESDVRPRATMGTVLRQQPLLRLVLLILPVIAVVILVMGVFGNSKKNAVADKVSSGSTVKDTSNSGAASESYRKAVEEANKQKIEQAEATGKSVIATAPTAVTSNQAAAADPLAAFTANPVVPQAPPPRAIVQAPPAPAPVQQQQPNNKLDQQLAQSYRQEMQAIIDGLKATKVSITKVTTKIDEGNGNGSGLTSQGQGAATGPQQQLPILITAGTVIYGQTLTEANSDIPAPILVSVLSGPLQGGRAIGTFQKADEYLILAFGTIIKNKKEYKVDAIAMDPETTLTGLQTDVDHHYFERFVLPAAAGFISGVGNYTQEAGSTVTNSTFGITQSYPPLDTHQIILSGLGQSANAISNAVNKESNVPITIHVASGTPIGIMFVKSVHEVVQ